jgi:pimeloyl-ACP methyl ester carboxylesterase
MNFLGLSYGSHLGAQYAALFPGNICTIALDGILQHSQYEATNLFVDTSSYELTLTHFFEWARTSVSSALQGQSVNQLWTSLLDNATSTPIPALSCNGTNCRPDVNAEEILFKVQGYLNFAGAERGLGLSWELFDSALSNATQGDASALSTSFADLEAFSSLGIGCLEWTPSASLSAIQSSLRMTTNYSPLVRGVSRMWMFQHACLGLPMPLKNPPMKLDIKTNATVLMTASTGDPLTGLPGAVGMLEEIENVILVVREGDGHTSSPLGGKTTEVIVEYLVSGEAPEEMFLSTSS